MMLAALKKRIPTPASLGGRALRAGGWNLFQLLAINILKLGSNLVMTRLLLPDAFALLSFVFIVITALGMATDVGIHNSIVREDDGDSPDFLYTAWVLKIGRGGLIGSLVLCAALGMYLSAGYWAPEGTVYADARLPALIAFSAIIPVMMGFNSTNLELAMRALAYKRLALIDIVAQVVAILSMILFAQISPTVWALMAGSTMTPLVKLIGTHLYLPGPAMQGAFKADLAWRIWHFGKWLIGSSIFTFAGRNADKLIFGALLNITTMGLLTIAYVWIGLGQTVITQLLGRVAYPVLSEVRRDRIEDLGRLLRRIQRVIDGVCISGFVAAVLLGPWLVTVLYTEPYHLSGSFVVLLGLGFLCLRFDILTSLLLTMGDSRGMMWLWAQRAAFLILCLTPVYNAFGLTAALVLTALHPLISVPFVLFRLRHTLDRRVYWESAAWCVVILVLGVAITQLFALS